MPKDLAVTLSKKNMEMVKEDLITFFMRNSTPIHEHTFINCTLETALKGKAVTRTLAKKFKKCDIIFPSKVSIVQEKRSSKIRLVVEDAIKETKPVISYLFCIGSRFVFTRRKLYVRVPNKYYPDNEFDYIVNVFGDN